MNVFNTTPETDCIILNGVPLLHPKPEYFYSATTGKIGINELTIRIPIEHKNKIVGDVLTRCLFVGNVRRWKGAFHLPNIAIIPLN